MRAYREDATEAAARTAEEHIAHKSADSDLVDTIDLSNLLIIKNNLNLLVTLAIRHSIIFRL